MTKMSCLLVVVSCMGVAQADTIGGPTGGSGGGGGAPGVEWRHTGLYGSSSDLYQYANVAAAEDVINDLLVTAQSPHHNQADPLFNWLLVGEGVYSTVDGGSALFTTASIWDQFFAASTLPGATWVAVAVPEPTTLGLFALTLLGVVGRRRRKLTC